MPTAVEFARAQYPRFLDELKDLLRIPSVSTLPEHKGDVHRAAEVLVAELKRIGHVLKPLEIVVVNTSAGAK